MYGNGPAGADGERRQHREDLFTEVPLDHLRGGTGLFASETIRTPCSASSGEITWLNARA